MIYSPFIHSSRTAVPIVTIRRQQLHQTMYYSPTAYATPHPVRLSRQRHSYHAQDTPPSTRSPSKYHLPQVRRYTAGSFSRSNKISHHLIPLISKFEALDALSHEIQVPSLRPAPLQISRNSSSRRGGSDSAASTHFDSIFSPRRRSRARYGDILIENLMDSAPEDMFASSTIKRSGWGKLKQTQSPYKVNSIRLRNLARQSSLATVKETDVGRKMRGCTGNSDPLAKREREDSVVRERIKFYDGCVEQTSFLCPRPKPHDSKYAHGSPAATSLRRFIAPTTPRIHQSYFLNGTEPPSGPSTVGGSKTRTISTKRGIQMSCERSKTNDKLEYRATSSERFGAESISHRPSSKDKDMRMLRKKSLVARSFQPGSWSPSKASGTKIPRARWRDSSDHTPPAPPSETYSSSTIKSTGTSMHTSKSRKIDGTRIPSLARRDRACQSTPTKGSCRGIHDKIKRWESKADTSDQLGQDQKEWYPFKNMKTPLTLRRSIFENPWSEVVGKELVSRGLNGDEIQAVVNEFQDIRRENGNDPTKGKWKMVVAPRLGRGSFGAQSYGETDESGEMDMRIIVREAQCGLAEPKPLRLLEMKRMILLCRERVSVGGSVSKDRGARAYPLKHE